jgi:hypothetical protein
MGRSVKRHSGKKLLSATDENEAREDFRLARAGASSAREKVFCDDPVCQLLGDRVDARRIIPPSSGIYSVGRSDLSVASRGGRG